MPEPLYDTFISYASPDLAFAEEAHRRLLAAGFRVWFDKARLNPGCDWHKEIEAGCEASRVLLPVLTPLWKKSDWTKFETYGADAVIPLIVEGKFVDTSTPPLMRFQGQALDLSAPDDAGWERLFDALRRLLAQPAPEKLDRLADVRYAANPFFVGREKELEQIHEGLHQNPTAVLTQGRVRAVTALGGVGKTTLARQYVEKFWRCYPQVFWVDCRLGVEGEFARLCDLLLPEHRSSTNVPEKARFALRELQGRADRLLVLDNAEDETSLQAWISKTGHCRTLITSRFTGWSAAVRSIHLYVLEPGPSRLLLVTRAGRDDFAALTAAERTACDELAKQLGYLPLALEQAAAYVEQQGEDFGFADYLRLYEAATRDLLAAGVLGSTEYPDSVMTTWKTTAAKLGAGSRAILRLCAFLAPTPLPVSVLIIGVEGIHGEAMAIANGPLPAPTDAESWVRDQVRQLRAYSMVEAKGQSIKFHPLVQTVQRLDLDVASGERRYILEESLWWIILCFAGDPDDVRSWPTLDPLAPHAHAVARYADGAGVADPTSRLMNSLGGLLNAKARYAEAEQLKRRALEIDELGLGPDHLDVAVRLNNLATLLLATNRLAEAEPLMRRAQEINELGLGSGHPRVGVNLNNLAQLLKETNRIVEAEPLMRRALAIDEANFGPDHLDVAVRLNNLALLLLNTNRLAEAEPLMRRALEIDARSLGSDHPKVAKDLNNLALLLKVTNRIAEAEPLVRRALAIDERSFGMDHPDVARDLNTLVGLLWATNRLAEAEPLMARVVTILTKSLGENHPNVAIALNNLATLLQTTNRLAEAEPLMRRMVGILLAFTVETGHSHPDMQTAVNNYASLLRAMGSSDAEVRQRLKDLLAEYGMSLGE
jgi:tetratricopeptide (TPR) repeat protein